MQVNLEDIQDTYGCDEQTAREIKRMIEDLKEAREGDIEDGEVPF